MKQAEKDKLSSLVASLNRSLKGIDNSVTDAFSDAASLDQFVSTATVDSDPVTPPVSTGTGVLQALPNGAWKDAQGNPKIIRGVEGWFGSSIRSKSAAVLCAAVKSLGANTFSPLMMTTDLGECESMLQACAANGLICAFNPDQGGKRAFLLQPATVALLKKYESILLLNLETELNGQQDGGYTQDQWLLDRGNMISSLRAAGYRCPIRVGSPNGGRAPLYALRVGATLLNADPLHNLFFACQLYWGANYYEQLAGVPTGPAGRNAFVDAAKASSLCFLIGTDATDDVGDTGEPAILDRVQTDALGVMHWQLIDRGPGSTDDDCYNPDAVTITLLGSTIQKRWVAEAHK